MKVTDLIKALEETLDAVGDVDVAILTDTPDGLFHADINPIAGVVQLPVDEYKDEMVTVFAVGWNGMFNEEGPILDEVEAAEESEELKNTDIPKLLH